MKKLGKGTVMFGCENTPFRLYLIVFFVLYSFPRAFRRKPIGESVFF